MRICLAYSLNSGWSALPKATAMAAMVCMCGPPWRPGKTDWSICLAYFFLLKINPAIFFRNGFVAHKIENLAHVPDRRAMRQMSAVGQVHTENRVAWFAKCQVDGLIHR